MCGITHAPQIHIGVFARGVIKRLVTRIYFDDASENEQDATLSVVPEDHRGTLIAQPDDGEWRFDIVLSGQGETVFFRC